MHELCENTESDITAAGIHLKAAAALHLCVCVCESFSAEDTVVDLRL